MKVTSVGRNKYAFDFGGGTETIVVDGTDQPGFDGTTLSVGQDGPNWKVVRERSGRTLLTATWMLSNDGRTLHDQFTAFGPDGSPSTVDYIYDRRAAGSLSARRLNTRAVEIVRRSNGKITITRKVELSPDLKTLTMTVYLAGKRIRGSTSSNGSPEVARERWRARRQTVSSPPCAVARAVE